MASGAAPVKKVPFTAALRCRRRGYCREGCRDAAVAGPVRSARPPPVGAEESAEHGNALQPVTADAGAMLDDEPSLPARARNRDRRLRRRPARAAHANRRRAPASRQQSAPPPLARPTTARLPAPCVGQQAAHQVAASVPLVASPRLTSRASPGNAVGRHRPVWRGRPATLDGDAGDPSPQLGEIGPRQLSIGGPTAESRR